MHKFSRKIIYKLVKYTLSFIEPLTNSWITYTSRPRLSSDFGHFPDPSTRNENGMIAIVMQGPVLEKWNFTIETIKMYKMMYPDAHIIVSTWNDTKNTIVVSLRELGVHVELSEYPSNPGMSHINYQIVSTRAGVQKAIEVGCVYCLKTRTDQRMYRHDALRMLLSALHAFPPTHGFSQLRARLIGLSLNTYKYRLYGVSDMFMFGYIEDMKIYWDIPLDSRVPFNAGGYNLLSHSQMRTGEVYFGSAFLERLGVELDWTLKHSWQVLRDFFCILDSSVVDLYWPKYNRFLENRRLNYSQRKACEIFQFSDWMGLYATSLNDQVIPEYVLQCSMDAPLKEEDIEGSQLS